MIISQILPRDNELMDNGDIDGQIIHDLEKYIQERKDYQYERLDTIVKEQSSHHYEQWNKDNQDRIKYAERILECVKAHMKGE